MKRQTPSEMVEGQWGTQYHCPDVAAVDDHLRLLRKRYREQMLQASSANLWLQLRRISQEMDLLLDRRLELTRV